MKIEKLDNEGRGIAYLDNKIVFVGNALPEEIAEVEIIQTKKDYAIGYAKKVENESKFRVKSLCPFYDKCGGCNLMHTTDEFQSDYKINKVKELLKKYADVNIEPILVQNDKQFNYRNKITLKVKNYEWGYYNELSHDFISINECLLASEEINRIISLKNHFLIKNGNITIRSNYLGEVLIVIESDEKVTINDKELDETIKGIIINGEIYYKDSYLIDKVLDFNFKISYDSFFQVNRYMNGKIFKILKDNLTGNNLLDLYCGVGSLGISIASNFANVYGIEKNKNAISNAKENALLNGIKNAKFYAGDTAKVLKDLNIDFDSLIVDPPRSGLNKETLSLILNHMPNFIAYVSCNVITLARDLKILKEKYEVTNIYGLMMFPNTYHIETICILKKL